MSVREPGTAAAPLLSLLGISLHPKRTPAAFAPRGNTNWRLLLCPGCQLEFVTLWQIEIF